MNTKALLAMAILTTATVSAWAQPETKVRVTQAPGQTSLIGTAKATATILKIDTPTRTVSLKTGDGKVVDLPVGQEARNFDQLKVGDAVTVEYKEAMTLSLKKGSGPLSMHEREISDRAAPGAKPGGTIGREVTATADVVAVNAAAKTVTLKGPKGRTVDLMVEDPERLKTIKKGDRVEAVYTEAVAVSVQPAAAN
jgi:Cu/Ag efflux protein CusF